MTPFRVIILYLLRGTFAISPVVGLGLPNTPKDLGFVTVRVKGFDTECASAPVCVPPRAVTATCLLELSGGVSSTFVYVGDVKPVCEAPVRGLGIEIDIMSSPVK